ncbi:MAG: glycosyltransferase [Alphaproteobacteria bacterium]|nr:glycosyltransferase [Alphaproteobacteria bacterium]
MKLTNKKRFPNGDRKYYFLGLPFLAKKRTAVAVRTYLFGIRISKRVLQGAPLPDKGVLSKKQLARAEYILRANKGRSIDQNYENKNKTIRILVEVHAIHITYTRGAGIFALGLLKAMEDTGKVRIDFLYDQGNTHLYKKDAFLKKYKAVMLDQLDDPDSEVYDFYFDPHIGCPYYLKNIAGNVRRESCAKYTVGILHDMIPFVGRETYVKSWGYDAVKNGMLNIFLSDHIFTNSKCTAIDAMSMLDIPRDKFTVIYGGVDIARFGNPSNEKLNNDLVALLGGGFNKNVDGAIVAFIKAYESGKIPKDARLVVASSLQGSSEEIIAKTKERLPKFAIDDRVVLFDRHRPSDKEVGDMLRACRATIYPSFYEGLGLPVLESYAMNKPCIASNNSSVREITAPECQFDPFDIDSITEKIIQIYNDQDLAKKSLDFGKKLLDEKCNWDTAAAKLVAQMENMLKPKEI